MSAASTGPSTATAPAVTGLDSALVSSLMLNVAYAIDRVLVPELAGSAKARAGECVGILNRVAQALAANAEDLAEPLAQLAAYSGPLAMESWKAAADAEGALLDRLEAGVRAAAQSSAADVASSRTFSREKLQGYLRQHVLGGESVELTDCRQLAGGRSKQTLLVALHGAKSLPAQIVVRQDWASAVTGTSVISEFALLRRVFEAGLRVPQPLLLEKSPEPLGAPFLIVTRMAGGPQGDIFNPPKSEALALQLAEQLARLHQLPPDEFAELGVATGAYTAVQLHEGLQGFRALNAKLGMPSRTIEIALDWLEQNIDRVKGKQAIVHNDLGCHNFLIEGEQLTAILDWELAQIGNPAADLGYIRDWIGKMTPWPRFMQAYHAAGGPAIDEATLDFYTLWCGVRLHCLLLQARAGVAMGMVKDTEITYAVAEFLPTWLHRVSRDLRAVLGKPPV